MAVSDQGAGKYKLTAESDILEGTFFVEFIEWISKSAAASDDLLIEDEGGLTIQEGVADGVNFHQLYPIGGFYTDPTLATLDSGTVYIQTAKNPTNF